VPAVPAMTLSPPGCGVLASFSTPFAAHRIVRYGLRMSRTLAY
jgi:hypothetical protein